MMTYETDDPLVSFLYILLRDHLPAGELEGIMVDHIEGKPRRNVLSNGYVAQHAQDLADRLRLREASHAP